MTGSCAVVSTPIGTPPSGHGFPLLQLGDGVRSSVSIAPRHHTVESPRRERELVLDEDSVVLYLRVSQDPDIASRLFDHDVISLSGGWNLK